MEEFECYMFNYDGNCKGSIRPSVCGLKCPFRKTLTEQIEQEKKVAKHLYDINYVGTYRSCVDNHILYSSDGKLQNLYC